MESNEKSTEYFSCECMSEVIAVTKWKDDPEVFLSIYSHGAGGQRPNWRYRLRYIWQIIRRGHPYTDAVVLNQDEARRLSDVIHQVSERP